MADRDPADDPLADYHPIGDDASAVDEFADALPLDGSWDAAVPASPRRSAVKATKGAPARTVAKKAASKRAGSSSAAEGAAAAAGDGAAGRPQQVVAPPAPEVPAGLNPIEMSAELAILAALLTSPAVFDDMADKLIPTDFGVPAHEAIFSAILACDASGRQFDTITVADEMRRAGTLARAGGVEYLNRIVTCDPAFEQLDAYIGIVGDRSLRRRMVAASKTIGSAALDAGRDARDALDVAEQTVFELGQKRTDSMTAPMPLVVANIMTEMATARSAKIVGHSTGFRELDRLTGGLRGGQLIVVGARPGMGKSVLALQMARHIAEVSGLVVPFLSYEMTASELGFRMLSSATGIPLSDLNRGYVPDGMDRDLAVEAEKMAGLPLLLEDQPPPTISAARSYVRRMARRSPLGAIVIDYVQLQSGDGVRKDENRTQEIGAISRTWKLIAKELDVPVIAVAQLNRGLEQRPNKRPLMSDLRESGSLEQDANLILFVYRGHVYNPAEEESHAELIVAKNRQGAQGTIPLDWDGPCVRFKDTDRKLDPFAAPAAGPAGQGGPGAAGPARGGFGGTASVARPDYF